MAVAGLGHLAKVLRQPAQVRVIGRADHLLRAQPRGGLQKRAQRRQIEIRVDAHELHILHAQPGLGQGRQRRGQQGAVLHQRIAGRVGRHPDQPQPDRVIADTRRQPDHLGRRQLDRTQMRQRNLTGSQCHGRCSS
jgi:hypothetical protein